MRGCTSAAGDGEWDTRLALNPSSHPGLHNRQSEDVQAVRAAGAMVSLAVLIALCWVALAGLALGGVVSALEAVLLGAGGYLALAVVVCAVVGFSREGR
jgi:hypothetical protein